MNDEIFSWLLTLQIVFPFFVLSIILLVVIIRSKNRLKDTMRELILNVKANEETQRQSIMRFLIDKLGFADAQAIALSSEIVKQRKFFFRTLVSSLLNKDVENLALLDEELTRVTQQYHKLSPAIATVNSESQSETPSSDAALQTEVDERLAQIETLKEKNRSLQQEVHITLTTLNNIFAEYSSMFGEEITRKDMSVEQILTAMESFSGSKLDVKADENPSQPTEPEIDDPDTADDLELNDDGPADERSLLDSMALEDVAAPTDFDDSPETSDDAVAQDDEPSWEDAFEESGDAIEDGKSG